MKNQETDNSNNQKAGCISFFKNGTTNQQMKLGALFEVLKYSQRYHNDKVLIITDYKYVMNNFVEGATEIVKGDWIVSCESGTWFIPDKVFRKIYERCD